MILVVAGRSHTYRAEAAELLLGLQRGPASPLEVLRSDPGPEGLADLDRFLERLWQTGAIMAAPG